MRLLNLLALLGTLVFVPFGRRDLSAQERSAYDFTFRHLTGDREIPLDEFRGKVVLIVNTASRCGFTSQYEGLERLYTTYAPRGFVVIGVPSNDFGGQEPGSSEEIASFCKLNYGVTFPLTMKEHVTGSDAHPFYVWAKQVLGFGTAPKWNFHKYLISRDGKLIDYFHSTTSPNSQRLTDAIEQALDAPEK